MKIEHFALQVPDPVAMADWYVAHLDWTIARAGSPPSHGRFLLESEGAVMLEIYRNPLVPVPNYQELEPLALHLAVLSENLPADRDRLVKAGATIHEDYVTSPTGDEFVMLRDPWGVPIQLVKRAKPMLNLV